MIPVCEPEIGAEELENVVACIKEKAISGASGHFIEQFEQGFSQYCGKKYGVACANGTVALHLAVASLDIGEGDEVIVSTFTNAASAFCIVYNRAIPVVVDSEPETWNINPDKIEEKITENTKAILPVHIYGHPCEMDTIMQIARKHDLYIIEDAAEAHGAEYKGVRVGGIGDIGCFSFYANKIITTGEGGMIVTDSEDIAERARILRNLAFSKERRFLHHHIGFNYRMTNIQAAIGVAQVAKIDEFVQRKRQMAALYSSLLKDVPGVALPVEKSWAKNVYWMYCILIGDEFSMDRDEVMAKLDERGIQTRTMFIPMNLQPAFHNMGLFEGESCPVAEELSRRGLYLPSGVGLTDDQIRYMCETLKELGSG
ncbi:DegT/DnrJ/EryC1/StrS family aminotransferase [Chloroflexota bacterium]